MAKVPLCLCACVFTCISICVCLCFAVLSPNKLCSAHIYPCSTPPPPFTHARATVHQRDTNGAIEAQGLSAAAAAAQTPRHEQQQQQQQQQEEDGVEDAAVPETPRTAVAAPMSRDALDSAIHTRGPRRRKGSNQSSPRCALHDGGRARGGGALQGFGFLFACCYSHVRASSSSFSSSSFSFFPVSFPAAVLFSHCQALRGCCLERQRQSTNPVHR